nr:hypothetical protein [Morchella crassipes]
MERPLKGLCLPPPLGCECRCEKKDAAPLSLLKLSFKIFKKKLKNERRACSADREGPLRPPPQLSFFNNKIKIIKKKKRERRGAFGRGFFVKVGRGAMRDASKGRAANKKSHYVGFFFKGRDPYWICSPIWDSSSYFSIKFIFDTMRYWDMKTTLSLGKSRNKKGLSLIVILFKFSIICLFI